MINKTTSEKWKGKGQVTVFIIVGIVILIMIGLTFVVFRGTQKAQVEVAVKKEAQVGLEAKEIKEFIDTCISQVTYDGLEKLGKQAGYIDVPRAIRLQNVDTGYWFLDQVNIQPTLNLIKKRLENYVDENLQTCTKFTVFENQGFDIKTDKPKSEIIFGTETVFISINYPLKIQRNQFSQDIEEFNQELTVRFRRIFEMSSQIINLQLDSRFNFSNPLKSLNKFDFDVSYKEINNETLLYTVTDNTRFEEGKRFSFNFASRFRRSELKRSYELQNNSNVIPADLPYVIYSTDRLAQLYILPGTTFSLKGAPVDKIAIQQSYPLNVTRSRTPMSENADDSVTYGDKIWNFTYPLYEFNPSGLRFNNPQRLVLYWDEDKIPHQGNIGILYLPGEEGNVIDGGKWRPLPVSVNYEENYAITDIPGFSQLGVVDCGVQGQSTASAAAKIEGGIFKLLLTLAIIVIAFAAIVASYGVSLGFSFTGGFNLTLSQIFTGQFFVGLGLQGWLLAGVFTTIALVGGSFIADQFLFDAGQNTITFTPTCTQNITISGTASGGTGSCRPTGTKLAVAGIPERISASIKKCNTFKKFTGGSCSMKCSTSYK